MIEPKCYWCAGTMEPSYDIRRWFCWRCADLQNAGDAVQVVQRLLLELRVVNIAVSKRVDVLYDEALKPGPEGDRAYAQMQKIFTGLKGFLPPPL